MPFHAPITAVDVHSLVIWWMLEGLKDRGNFAQREISVFRKKVKSDAANRLG